jgi:molecular chaperone DnaK (HSP70)
MKVFTTSKDNQDSLKIALVQGDSGLVQDSDPIGEFVFRGIHPAPKGQARVEAIFIINEEGILSVTARDPDTGAEQKSVLAVSSTMQRTYHQDLIKPKKPVPKKEAQKIITHTVTKEKKLKAAQAPPKPAPAKPTPAKPTRPPTPPLPKKPARPGLMDRIKSWFKGSGKKAPAKKSPAKKGPGKKGSQV